MVILFLAMIMFIIERLVQAVLVVKEAAAQGAECGHSWTYFKGSSIYLD